VTDEREPVLRALGVSSPPKGAALDDDYVRSSLRSIKLAQAEQAKIEHERTGASKTVGRLVTIFGSLITAGAIAGFAWIWNANATNASQAVEIEVLENNPPNTHGHVEIVNESRERERRIGALEASFVEINNRLDRNEREQAARHAEVLEELRRLRAGSPRRWGSTP